MEYDTTYVPPETLADMDEDLIHERMLAALPTDIDKSEGGFAYDYTRPAALEKASMINDLNDAIQLFFPAWSFDSWLDQIATMVGLARKPAGYAQGYLTVEGTTGRTINAGFLFATPSAEGEANIEFEVVESVTIGSLMTAQVYVRCTQPGTVGNVAAGSITLMVEPITGISSVTNEYAISGGTEQEDDDSLRERIQERDLNSESSFVGNVADFKRWALEVTGVGSVVVVPEWMGVGTGTVKLIIMDSNGSPANPTIISDVYNHIMSPDNEDDRLAQIGTILTVTTASLLQINISASVQISTETSIEDVKTALAAAFEAYREEAYEDGWIRHTRVGSLLSEVFGVIDYSNLLLNGSADNIKIEPDYYPNVGTITLAVI